MTLEYKKFKEVNLEDPFFDSLKADYKEFVAWFAKKAEDKAYVFEDTHNAIGGFLYLKIEDGEVTDVTPPLPPARRLKVGTFKINAHGTRLGERFMKKVFDHAVHAGVGEIYVTIFAHHAPLVALFKKYGFVEVASKTTPNGTELVLIKRMGIVHNDVVLDYPVISLRDDRQFLLALYPEWHTRLLPDSILKTESAEEIVKDVSHSNSIHKVYLTAMKGTEGLMRGDVLFIYRTSDQQGAAFYRSVVSSICVMEEVRNIRDFRSEADFIAYCKPYSVFSEQELKTFYKTRKYPVVLRFTYNIALTKRPNRKTLIEEVGLDGGKYWGFLPVTKNEFKQIAEMGHVNESLVVD